MDPEPIAITWTSPPLPRLEDRDLRDLDWPDLAVYCYDLQCELRTVRTLWHDTLAALTRLAEQRDRATWAARKRRRDDP